MCETDFLVNGFVIRNYIRLTHLGGGRNAWSGWTIFCPPRLHARSCCEQVLQPGDEEGGGRGRPLPPQLGQLFSQVAEGTDAITEVKNNLITITGPEVGANSFLISFTSITIMQLDCDTLL